MNRFSLITGAILLCGFSLVASVAFWVTRQPNIEKMIMAGAFATGMEICKFAFFALAKKTESKLWSFFLYVIAIILLAFSVFVTVVFLQSGATTNAEKISSSSFVYQEQQDLIHKLNSESSTLLKSQENDLKGIYKTRGYSISDRLKAIRIEKEAAIGKLNTLKAVRPNGEDSIFETVGVMLHITADIAQQILFLIGAILVDVCGIVCILAITVEHKKTEVAATLKINKATFMKRVIAMLRPVNTRVATLQYEVATLQKPEVAETLQVAKSVEHIDIAPVIKPCNKTAILGAIKRDIAVGKYGKKLKITAIMEETKQRNPDMKKLILELIEEGIVQKTGNRFELIESATVVPIKRN